MSFIVLPSKGMSYGGSFTGKNACYVVECDDNAVLLENVGICVRNSIITSIKPMEGNVPVADEFLASTICSSKAVMTKFLRK